MNYQDAVVYLERLACGTCGGDGLEREDDHGNMRPNGAPCKPCNGTGFKDGNTAIRIVKG